MRHTKLAADISDVHSLEIAAPEPTMSELEQVEIALEEAGFTLSQASRAAEALESTIERIAIERAAETIRHLLLRLGNTSAGIALQRVILGDQGESLREAAARVEPKSISAAGMLKNERAIRARLTVGAIVNEHN